MASRTTRRRRIILVAGLAAAALALASPVHTLAEERFSVHMVQHLLLIVVAAPLIIAGRPGPQLLAAIPLSRRRTLLRRTAAASPLLRSFTLPVVGWPLHVGVVWFWHLPGPYEAAVGNPVIHASEHALFLLTALVFWAPVLGARRMNGGAALLYLFAATVQGTALGALIAFAPGSWYTVHLEGRSAGVLADQQLAGLLMWMPGGMVYAGVALTLFAVWLGGGHRRASAAAGRLDPLSGG